MGISRFVSVLWSLSFAAACSGWEAEARFPWVDPAGVEGAVLIAGGEPSEAVREKFKELAGGADARVVVVPVENLPAGRLLVSPPELPSAVVAAGFFDQEQREGLIGAISKQPERVGVCIERGTALAIHGRRADVLGDGSVTILLAASAGRALREMELKSGARHDWTMLRRAAIERSLANFPPQELPPPVVEHGSLLIHGGGEMPREVGRKFLELAGGSDAPVVVLPIAAEGDFPEDASRDTRVLTRAGATNVKSLRARTRSEVESPEFAAALEGARGVWFNGGRQWRFVDAYMGTRAEELLRGVLARGGVIGGSSAGASIQSQYMPRGSPLGNLDMMAEGYERGLGFLPGAAVDQHFTQRRRHSDMTALVRRYPQVLGIGLDEGTAIIVQGPIAEVTGRGNAFFYDYRAGPPAGERDYMRVGAGATYDLVERRLAAPER